MAVAAGEPNCAREMQLPMRCAIDLPWAGAIAFRCAGPSAGCTLLPRTPVSCGVLITELLRVVRAPGLTPSRIVIATIGRRQSGVCGMHGSAATWKKNGGQGWKGEER